MSLNATLIKSTVVAALGGLLFGFDTAVISGTTGSLTEAYQLSPFLLGVTVFSALLGTVLGAMLAGFPGERFGRRDVRAGEVVVTAWPDLEPGAERTADEPDSGHDVRNGGRRGKAGVRVVPL